LKTLGKIRVETKQVALSEIRPNPDNPRSITKAGLDRLAKSLKEFPEMLEIREVVVDETMTVLGGNMRLRALEQAGAKQCLAKIVTGLTDAQKREFTIKDNGAFGDWDFDALANAWDDLPLADWGVNLPVEWGADPGGGEESDSVVPDKDPNIIVRLSFHPGVWLGQREQILEMVEKIKKTYNCDAKVEE